jgi:hypothetical protein
LGVSDWQWTVCDTCFHVGRACALAISDHSSTGSISIVKPSSR